MIDLQENFIMKLKPQFMSWRVSSWMCAQHHVLFYSNERSILLMDTASSSERREHLGPPAARLRREVLAERLCQVGGRLATECLQ